MRVSFHTVRKSFLFIEILLTLILLTAAFSSSHRNTSRRHQFVEATHLRDDRLSFYTDIYVNDYKLTDVMIDTGSVDSTISIDLAEKINLPWKEGKVVEYTLADDSTVSCRILDTVIRVGNVVHNAPMSVCDKGDALLGMSFINQTTLHIQNDVLTIK